MRKPLRKLLVLSGLLSLVLVAVHASPAQAVCYICVSDDPCTEIEFYSNSICCPPGRHPICVNQYDSNGCIVGVTAAGCH